MHPHLYRNQEALQGVLQGMFSQISKVKLVSILKQLIIKPPSQPLYLIIVTDMMLCFSLSRGRLCFH